MPPSKNSLNPRIAAVRIVSGVLDKRQNIDEASEGRLAGMSPRDAGFSLHLAYGVLRWLGALDWLAAQLMDRPLKARDKDIQRLIHVGLFQLWQDGSAEHAAIYETAECARQLRKNWAVGLINAVLRRFQREQASLLAQLAGQPERFSHPAWLVDALKKDWPEHWEAIVTANNQQAGLWLRVNRTRANSGMVSGLMDDAGFTTRRHDFAPDAIEVSPAAAVEKLPGFSEGLWSVQDPAAQLAVEWLDVQPGQRVLDACAAPGGKTCHIRESAPDAHVVSLDRSGTRLERVADNAKRLGLADPLLLETIASDALDTDEWWNGEPFDRILLDAPCTATGVIRRHPEIRWLRDPSQVNESVQIQSALLRRLWPLLKPGGILVYATCSVLSDENSQQISRFIGEHDDARLSSPETGYGHAAESGCQVLPGEADMDGFFYSRIIRAN